MHKSKMAQMTVPDQPEEFFRSYLPSRFSEVEESFSEITSAGALTFYISEKQVWSYRVVEGKLTISTEMPDDTVLQVSVAEDDFKPIFVRSAEAQADKDLKTTPQLEALKATLVDADRANRMRQIAGQVAIVIQDEEKKHQLFVTPGTKEVNRETPECRIECSMNDFIEMQSGIQNPMQLALAGKIKIVGNAQIPMELSALFV